MTQFWEYILQHGAEKAGETEYDQGVKLANAASRTPSLEHYIFATLPSASKATNGKIHVPHMDYKANVDVYIKEKLPELAKKTTFVWHGMYASNLAFFPNMKPTFFVSTNVLYVLGGEVLNLAARGWQTHNHLSNAIIHDAPICR